MGSATLYTNVEYKHAQTYYSQIQLLSFHVVGMRGMCSQAGPSEAEATTNLLQPMCLNTTLMAIGSLSIADHPPIV